VVCVCHAAELRKTAERIQFLFGVETLVGQITLYYMGVLIPLCREKVRVGENFGHCEVYEHLSHSMRPSTHYFDILFYYVAPNT